jgi:hypothetical protein
MTALTRAFMLNLVLYLSFSIKGAETAATIALAAAVFASLFEYYAVETKEKK